jgi:hypothetical protein
METLKFLAILVALASVDCTPAQVAQATTDTGQAIDLTDAACIVAENQPLGQPYVDLVCTLAEGGEQLVSVVIGAVGAAEGDAGVTGMGAVSPSALMRVPVKQIRIRLPKATADRVMAKQKK